MRNITRDAKADPPAGLGLRWAGVRERGVYAGLWFMLQIYRLLGRPGFGFFLLPVIGYFFVFGRPARVASRQFLQRVWSRPEGRRVLGHKPTLLDSFRHYLSFGAAILDKVAAWTGSIRLEDISYDNRESFARLERTGQGGVLIGSHLGNVEICRALGSLHRGLKINVLVHTSHAASFNRLLTQANCDAGLKMIQTADFGVDTAIALRERVAQGELIVIVGDRTPASNAARTVRVPFMGADADFPEGPFILAALLDCPVLLVFCMREGRRFQMIFEEFAAVRLNLPRKARREHLRAIAVRYAERLEHHALRYPYQWFNFFDFWAPMPPEGGTATADPSPSTTRARTDS
jgi:predicted LPLAT superfamily acyltransferase